MSQWTNEPMTSKVTTHVSHNEQLIFERSQPGRAGFSLPGLDVEETALDEIIPREFQRDDDRSEEHTSELQSHSDLVCRLLLEKKKTQKRERKQQYKRM